MAKRDHSTAPLIGKLIRDFKSGELSVERKLMIGFIAIMSCYVLYMAVLQHLSLDTIALSGVIIAASACVLYFTKGRTGAVDKLSTKVTTLENSHEQLMHEVAKHRYGVSILRDGLNALIEENPAITLSENQKILAVKNSLNAIPSSVKDNADQYNGNILRLEVRPQKRVSKPANDFEKELGLDFSSYDPRLIERKLKQAVRSQHIQIFLQAVMRLPQRQDVFYEVYSRIRISPGVYMPAEHYLKQAADQKMIPAIDAIMLMQTLKMLENRSKNDKKISYILNISDNALRQKSFIQTLVKVLASRKDLAQQIIFELPQRAYETMSKDTMLIIKMLQKTGCRFSMDRLNSGEMNIDRLAETGITFIKMDAVWLLKEMQTTDGVSRLISLKNAMNHVGIDIIAEKIENESELNKLSDLNLNYGQGYIFGKPDITRASATTGFMKAAG